MKKLRAREATEKQYQRRFLALDGLRGVAVLLVVLNHWSDMGFMPKTFHIDEMGGIGVLVFFVLSGFLITHLLLEERDKTGRLSLTSFYARRTLRIWPLYFAVLGIYFFVLPHFDHGYFESVYPAGDKQSSGNAYYLLAYPFFLQNYLFGPSDVHLGLDIFWSLAVEEHFYLMWPLLIVALRGRWLIPSLACILTATVSLRALTLLGVLPEYEPYYRMTHTYLDGIALGCFVACLYHARPGFLKALSRQRWPYFIGWAILLFLLLEPQEQTLMYHILPYRDYYKDTLGALAAALVVASIVGEAKSPRAILGSRSLTYTGKVSYGVYVLHPIVLVYVAALAGYFDLLYGATWFLALIVYAAIAVGVAGLSFTFFEAPILRFKKRFARV